MTIIYLIISLVFASGFYYMGNKISYFLNLNSVIKKISNPIYQYTTIGIAFVIFIFYPVFYLGFFKIVAFSTISYVIILLGLYNLFKNFNILIKFIKFNFNKVKKIDISNSIVFLIIFLFFLLSVTPITSGDSVSYHMGAAKYIIQHGQFSTDLFYAEAPLVSANEFLNAFALSIKAYQFTSLINFIGVISILGIIKRFSEKNLLSKENKNFLFLCVLSCPILVFLITTSKSQLFSTSLIFFSYSLLIHCLNHNEKKDFLAKASYFLIALPIVAIQTKISFSLSFFIIITTFFLVLSKKIEIKNFIFLFVLFCVIGLLPSAFWKQNVYDYPFYNFIINPFPMNIPGYDVVYDTIKLYVSEKFPYILLLPLDKSDLTQFIGLGVLTIFFLFKYNFKNKKIIISIILFYLIVYTALGQRASRFYLEIYLLIILILSFIIKNFYKKRLFKILNFGIIAQSLFVICISLFGVFTLLPGIFSDNLNKKVLSKYATGYNLYSWANEVLPDDSVTLISHRSFYFAEKNLIYFGMGGSLDERSIKYHLKKLKEKKINYIIFFHHHEIFSYDKFNFKECTKGLFKSKKNVGFYETRNPFVSGNYYNAYIYHFDSSKLDHCVKLDF